MILNKEQLEAVRAPLKPIIVIAPAGTGKTTVLTERIVYLIEEKDIPPESILAITFTNLAAAEMKNRIHEKLGNKTPNSIGTVHSMFEKILRSGIKKLHCGRNGRFRILGDYEQESILRRAFEECDITQPRDIEEVKAILSRWKTKMVLKEIQFKLRGIKKYEGVFEEYENLLRNENKLDFDDILIYSYLLLNDPKEQEQWRNKYQGAILVDECQDLNELQWGLIKKLIPKEKSFNFFAVGDRNQCIYLFNGAKENIFEEIKELFGDVEEVSLIVNYRSDRSIVDLSGELKKHKNTSISHKLNEGTKKTFNDLNLALEEISKDENKGSWVILFNRHREADGIIKRFIQENIPFRVSKFRLLENRKIDYIVKVLEVIFFRSHWSLISLLCKKESGLDRRTKKKLINLNTRGSTLVEYLLDGEEWKEKVFFDIEGEKEKVIAIIDQIKWFKNQPRGRLSKLVSEIYPLLFSGLTSSSRERIELFIKWLENIQEKFGESASQDTLRNIRSLAEFTKEEIKNSLNEWVVLSTIYRVKGLEWDNVIVLNYDMLFDKFIRNDPEYKHLAYVAVTRAKHKLFLIQRPKDIFQLKDEEA